MFACFFKTARSDHAEFWKGRVSCAFSWPVHAQSAGYPQDRENRENGENIFPAGKSQGISFCTAKFRENLGNFIWVIEIQEISFF